MEEFLSLFERVSSALAAHDALQDQGRLIGSPVLIRPNESHGFCNYRGANEFIHVDVYRRRVLFAVDIAGKSLGLRVGPRRAARFAIYADRSPVVVHCNGEIAFRCCILGSDRATGQKTGVLQSHNFGSTVILAQTGLPRDWSGVLVCVTSHIKDRNGRLFDGVSVVMPAKHAPAEAGAGIHDLLSCLKRSPGYRPSPT